MVAMEIRTDEILTVIPPSVSEGWSFKLSAALGRAISPKCDWFTWRKFLRDFLLFTSHRSIFKFLERGLNVKTYKQNKPFLMKQIFPFFVT